MKIIALVLMMFLLMGSQVWGYDEVSAEYLVNSSRINKSGLVLARVEKLVRPSGFTCADPPRGTMLIEQVYCGRNATGALDFVLRPEFDIMVAEKKGMTPEQAEKQRLKVLSQVPMAAPPLNKLFFVQISRGLESSPQAMLFPYSQKNAAALEALVKKKQSERNFREEAQRIVQTACTSGQGLLKAKVVRLEKEFGCTCAHLPSGVVQVDKVYLGKFTPGQLSVTWDDFEQCKNRNCPVGVSPADREHDRKRRARILVPCPQIGEVQLMGVRLSPDGKLSAEAQDFDEELAAQIDAYANQLRSERTAHNKRWDQLPFGQIVNQSTDVVLAKLINQSEIKILKRLKDSASAAAQSVQRPVYLLPEFKYPVASKPFDGEVICFLSAGRDCSAWSPTQENQSLGTKLYTAPSETYERLTFRYKPARNNDWCIPSTAARLDAVKKALSASRAQPPGPRTSDRIAEFVQLYYNLDHSEMDEKKLSRLMELAEAVAPMETIYYRNCISKAIQFNTKNKNMSEVNRLKNKLRDMSAEFARQNSNFVMEPLSYWAYLDE